MTEDYVRFTGAGLEFEGILHLPKGDGPFPAVAVCHPHPLYGGDMDNNVVLAICHTLAEASLVALRFNFRGVGRSQGDFAEGIGEQDDVNSALTFLLSLGKVDPGRIGLAGYSFGAKVALPVALQNELVQAVAFISPFLSTSDWQQLRVCTKPKLFICGSNDYLVSSSEAQKMASELQQSQYEVIPGADHFWQGYEGEITKRVPAFFRAALGG